MAAVTPRRRGRSPRALALLAVAPAAAGFALVLTAAPALAATATFTSPSANASYDGTDGHASVPLSAKVSYGASESGTANLLVEDPMHAQNAKTGCLWTANSANYNGGPLNGGTVTVSSTLDLTRNTYPASCGSGLAGQLPVNGTWTASVGNVAGSAPSLSFVLRIKPVAPTGLTGASTAPLQETIGWDRNPELDTHLYAILDGSGNTLGTFPAGTACGAKTCSGTVSVNGSGSQSFQVKAFRRSAPAQDPDDPSTTGDLTATSASVTYPVAAPTSSPTSAPSPTASTSPGVGTSGNGGSGAAGSGSSPGPAGSGSGGVASSGPAPAASAATGSGPSRSGGSPVAGSGPALLGHTVTGPQATALSNAFRNFGAPAGIAKLPPLPAPPNGVAASDQPAAPGVDDGEPTDQGTYRRSLGYTPQSTTTARTTVTTPLSSVADALGVSPVGLWRSVAGSLLLLLGAAHVRRFARSPSD